MSAADLLSQAEYFERAVNRLADALAQPKNEYIRDSAIQRFEFTFELAWKLLKRYLSLQGLEARSPRESIRGAFEVGLLPEDEGWLAMIELRNLTSHTYDEEVAERIYGELLGILKRFQSLLITFQEKTRELE